MSARTSKAARALAGKGLAVGGLAILVRKGWIGGNRFVEERHAVRITGCGESVALVRMRGAAEVIARPADLEQRREAKS